jgi:putative PEP-CTERM system histidine kinase
LLLGGRRQLTPFTVLSLLPYLAAAASVLLAFASVLRKQPTPATWCFFVGMLALALDTVITAFALRATTPETLVFWLAAGVIVKSAIPAVWLGFSLTYSRSASRESLNRWAIPLALIGAIPVGLAVGLRTQLFQLMTLPSGDVMLQTSPIISVLNVVLLLSLVLVLVNIEQTFRSAVGTARWRIKLVVIGLAVIFGARIYVRAQTMLFSAPDLALWAVESGSLLIGCVFLGVGYARTKLAEIDVYPSLAVLRSSLTVLLVGGYLFLVGVLAQLARRFGGAESFQVQAFVVLLGVSGLALLLLSDRARQRIHLFTVRHFSKARHDSLRIWTMLSQRLASVRDSDELWAASVKLISETFDVLTVTVWLVDADSRTLAAAASTAAQPSGSHAGKPGRAASSDVSAGLARRSSPFDLDAAEGGWAEELQQLNPSTFPNGGNRWCIPLRAGERAVGVVVLADRVNAAPYTVEELELLQCIADQTTSVLLNLRLAEEIAASRELGAFHTMSTFFVHDLKNAAASLNLMLKNLPIHFDDPEFRADALRGIGNATRRIEEMIGRLSAFRQQPALARVDTDLNQLVAAVLDEFELTADIELSRGLQPLPRVAIDREAIKSVVTNLVMNARDASDRGGRIRVSTESRDGRVNLAVTDAGAGMSAAFIQERLFRPFQSTKTQGLGIGLFQCRAIVQAHGGSIHVVSEPGVGTTFTVTLPV